MRAVYFTSQAAFHAWLEENHETAAALLVGFFRTDSGKPGITYPEARDEALCFGWIDGIRRKVDATRYTIRFTPRRPRSTWSLVNIERVKALRKLGRMQPAGTRAFAERDPRRSGTYAFEQRMHPELDAAEARLLRANATAWRFFQVQPPSYRRIALWYIVSAKRPETRTNRLQLLIDCSAGRRRIPPLAPRGK